MRRIPIIVASISERDLARFAEKCKRQEDGCLNWVGANNPRGYGRFKLGGKLVLPHRFSFAIANGYSPEDGVIDHICNNPRCVEPNHLRHLTYAENTARGESAIAASTRHVVATGTCTRGHPRTAEFIRITSGNRVCKACKRETEAAAGKDPEVRAARARRSREYRRRLRESAQ